MKRFLPAVLPALVALLILVVSACSANDPADDSGGDTDVNALVGDDAGDEGDSSEAAGDAASSDDTSSSGDTDSGDADSSGEAVEQVDAAADASAFDAIVFNDDFGATIQPLIAESCASCHNEGGAGSAHWQLETVADIEANHAAISGVVKIGYMPPWPAGGDSILHAGDRRLRQDQIDAIVAWSDAGGEIDVAADTVVTAPSGLLQLDEVDQTLEPREQYEGDLSVIDDYRCNIYDPQFTEDVFIEGYRFVPDQAEIVHHAIGYILPAKAMEDAVAAAAEDPQGGWSCFGSSGLPYSDPIFLGWAPGQDPTQFPEGSGLQVKAGDFIVIQVHYHNEVETAPDNSTLEIDLAEPGAELDQVNQAEYIAPVEIPCSDDESGPLCDRDAAYADAVERFGEEGVRSNQFNSICGTHHSVFQDDTDGQVSSSCELPIYEFGQLISVLGHEHEIGTSFKMTLNPDTPDERVLLDIPVWDFDWQLNYSPVDDIILKPGDTVLVECSWDRSLLPDDVEPRYILWADGTNDEMCFSTITTREIN